MFDESDDDELEVLFMRLDTQNDAIEDEDDNYEDEENSEIEKEVDLEVELVGALKELRKDQKEVSVLEKNLQEY